MDEPRTLKPVTFIDPTNQTEGVSDFRPKIMRAGDEPAEGPLEDDVAVAERASEYEAPEGGIAPPTVTTPPEATQGKDNALPARD